MIKSLFTNPKLKKDPVDTDTQENKNIDEISSPSQTNTEEPKDRIDDILRVVRN